MNASAQLSSPESKLGGRHALKMKILVSITRAHDRVAQRAGGTE
jgi:hypothetical protein